MIASKTHRLALNLGLALAAAALLVGGCTPDAEHRDIPATEVKPVTAYGFTLDESATPQQVAYVLLRAIADDVDSAQAQLNTSLSGEARRELRDKQKAAMKTTYALAAYSVIEKRVLEVLNLTRVEKKPSLGDERDQQLYDFVHQWAAIVAYYVPSFPANFKEADARMKLVNGTHIDFPAWHNPAGTDDKSREAVKIDIELAGEPGAGGKTYWRVAKVAYFGRPGAALPQATTRAVITTRPASAAPAPTTKPS